MTGRLGAEALGLPIAGSATVVIGRVCLLISQFVAHSLTSDYCIAGYSLGYLSLPSPRDTYTRRIPAYWLGLRRGAFTCVGWQVTPCDPVWQVTPRSSVMGLVFLNAIGPTLVLTFQLWSGLVTKNLGF